MILIGTSTDLAYAPPAGPCDVVDLSIREVVKDRPGPERRTIVGHLASGQVGPTTGLVDSALPLLKPRGYGLLRGGAASPA
jgi:hypothetical protein